MPYWTGPIADSRVEGLESEMLCEPCNAASWPRRRAVKSVHEETAGCPHALRRCAVSRSGHIPRGRKIHSPTIMAFRTWCNKDCKWLDEGECVPSDKPTSYEDRLLAPNGAAPEAPNKRRCVFSDVCEGMSADVYGIQYAVYTHVHTVIVGTYHDLMLSTMLQQP